MRLYPYLSPGPMHRYSHTFLASPPPPIPTHPQRVRRCGVWWWYFRPRLLRGVDVFGHPFALSTPSTRDTSPHRVDIVHGFFLQSSELGLPHPLTRRRVCTPLWFRGGHIQLRERDGWSQYGRGDRHCCTLGIYVCTVCVTPSNPSAARPAR
jgi:hypothetical protein